MTKNNLCHTHQDQPTTERCDTCNRIRDERKVASKAISELLDAGFRLSVNDGCDTTLKRSDNASQILAAMFTTDEDYLLASRGDERWGAVRFIWGNSGADCINDYTCKLEPYLTATFALQDSMS